MRPTFLDCFALELSKFKTNQLSNVLGQKTGRQPVCIRVNPLMVFSVQKLSIRGLVLPQLLENSQVTLMEEWRG